MFILNQAAAAANNLADLTSPALARANLGVPLRAYSTLDPQFAAKGDAQQAWGVVSVAASSAALTVAAQATNTVTATIAFGSQTFVSGTAIFTQVAMVGQPITIVYGGVTFKTTIAAVVNTTQAGLAAPAPFAISAASATVTIGLGFAASDVGKAIQVPGAAAAGATLTTTIAAFTSATAITLGATASTTLSSAQTQVTWGTDDSAALNAAVTAALTRADRYLYVPAAHFAPSLTMLAAYVAPIGEGALFAAPLRRYVIPTDAPVPAPPPPKGVSAPGLPALRAAPAPVVVVAGDSIWQMANDPAIAMEPQALLQKVIAEQNLDKAATFYSRAIGAQTWATFDTVSNAFPNWYSVTTTPWLGTAAAPGYIYNLAPDVLAIGFQNNDGFAFSTSAFMDAMSKIDGWAKVPDRILATHWSFSLLAGLATTTGADYVAQFLRTYARVRGFGLLDFHRQGTKLRDGYDPVGMGLLAVPGFNDTSAFRLNLPYIAPFSTTGYEITLTDVTGQSGPSFWAHYGNELQFQIGYNADNLLRVGYDSVSGNLYYQFDVSAAYPGAGCVGGTVPTIKTTVSIASGANTLTVGASLFTAADSGKYLTVPGAGASGAPLVGVMQYVSATSVTLWTSAAFTTAVNAATTLSSSSQVVLRGNPKIVTALAVLGDASGHTALGVSVVNDNVVLWYQDRDTGLVYRGPGVRFGGAFSPKITGSTNFPLGFALFGSVLNCFVETPALSQPSLMDLDVNGPSTFAPVSNTAYIGAQGGDGTNHLTGVAASRIVRPVIEAQDFSAGTNTARPVTVAVPTTGFSATIPNGCSLYQMTPAGTLASGTLTLPATFPQNTPLAIASTQTITALTLNANAGQTINGAATTLAANTSVGYFLNGTSWYRLN